MNTFRKGFTVVEVMIGVILIGLLAAMVIPAFQKVKENQKRHAIETIQVEAPAISGNPVEVGNPRFTYEKQNSISYLGAIKTVILVTDKTTGKQFLMVEDFGVADLTVSKIESAPSSRYGR